MAPRRSFRSVPGTTRLRVARLALAPALFLTATPILAQHPAPTGQTYKGCYVPSTGTVYIVSEPNTAAACGTTRKVPDVPVNLFDGGGALRAGTATAALDGFAVTGTATEGQLAATGPGTRLLWYPRKSAFRVGSVSSNHWDDANIGSNSIALGRDIIASAPGSVAIGDQALASGWWSLALGGRYNRATGESSVAIGHQADAVGVGAMAMGSDASASGEAAIAIGWNVRASGTRSMALGHYVGTGHRVGALTIGDAGGSLQNMMYADADNQFSARFAGGYRLFSNSGLTSGVSLAAGGGSWQSVSDVRKKTAFRDVEGEAVLAKLAAMPVRTWRYRAQDAAIRHMGPTAQDFHAAFGLGESDTTITTVDADGVALAAAKALEQRTRALQRELAMLRAANQALRAENVALRRRQRAGDDALAARLTRLEHVLDGPSREPARAASTTPRTPAATIPTGGADAR
jgi:hypothetical protein